LEIHLTRQEGDDAMSCCVSTKEDLRGRTEKIIWIFSISGYARKGNNYLIPHLLHLHHHHHHPIGGAFSKSLSWEYTSRIFSWDSRVGPWLWEISFLSILGQCTSRRKTKTEFGLSSLNVIFKSCRSRMRKMKS
jgi:hypothetical protein